MSTDFATAFSCITEFIDPVDRHCIISLVSRECRRRVRAMAGPKSIYACVETICARGDYDLLYVMHQEYKNLPFVNRHAFMSRQVASQRAILWALDEFKYNQAVLSAARRRYDDNDASYDAFMQRITSVKLRHYVPPAGSTNGEWRMESPDYQQIRRKEIMVLTVPLGTFEFYVLSGNFDAVEWLISRKDIDLTLMMFYQVLHNFAYSACETIARIVIIFIARIGQAALDVLHTHVRITNADFYKILVVQCPGFEMSKCRLAMFALVELHEIDDCKWGLANGGKLAPWPEEYSDEDLSRTGSSNMVTVLQYHAFDEYCLEEIIDWTISGLIEMGDISLLRLIKCDSAMAEQALDGTFLLQYMQTDEQYETLKYIAKMMRKKVRNGILMSIIKPITFNPDTPVSVRAMQLFIEVTPKNLNTLCRMTAFTCSNLFTWLAIEKGGSTIIDLKDVRFLADHLKLFSKIFNWDRKCDIIVDKTDLDRIIKSGVLDVRSQLDVVAWLTQDTLSLKQCTDGVQNNHKVAHLDINIWRWLHARKIFVDNFVICDETTLDKLDDEQLTYLDSLGLIPKVAPNKAITIDHIASVTRLHMALKRGYIWTKESKEALCRHAHYHVVHWARRYGGL